MKYVKKCTQFVRLLGLGSATYLETCKINHEFSLHVKSTSYDLKPTLSSPGSLGNRIPISASTHGQILRLSPALRLSWRIFVNQR